MAAKALTLRARVAGVILRAARSLNTVWAGPAASAWRWIREPYAGAWQRGVAVDGQNAILAFSPLFAIITGIATDIAKMRIKLCEIRNGLWVELSDRNSPFWPVLRKPNHYQNRISFIEQWIISKLLWGNTYVLKERDARGIVVALYILDPCRVVPLVASDGSVFYQLNTDYLSGLEHEVTVPASEIIHDKMCCLWHPLVGVSPLYAAGMSATMGNRIQSQSTAFFGQNARPSGILTAPDTINDEDAAELGRRWNESYGGENAGKIAVMGNDLKFQAVSGFAEQSQLIEQLKWTAEDVARPFHYPSFKVGGPLPAYAGNIQAMIIGYFTDCLQELIEKLELCLDEGLSLPDNLGTELDIDNLLRMDTLALYESNNKAGDWMKINEQRFRANLPPLPIGGDTVYRQEQDHSIEAIAKRDGREDPFGAVAPPMTPPAPASVPAPTNTGEGRSRELLELKTYLDSGFAGNLAA